MRRIVVKRKPIPDASDSAVPGSSDSVVVGIDLATGPDMAVVWPMPSAGAVTGRVSGSTPNQSNIPRPSNGVMLDAMRRLQHVGVNMSQATEAMRSYGSRPDPTRPGINLSVNQVALDRNMRTMSTDLFILFTVNTDTRSELQVSIPRELIERTSNSAAEVVQAMTPDIRRGLYDIVEQHVLPSLLTYIATTLDNNRRY